jgi:hypothetical protein
MAKKGQHSGDDRDSDVSRGHNNPSKSMTITTGSYKKHETYARQAREHKDTNPEAQRDKNEWNPDTRFEPSIEGSTRARRPRSGRSGSHSGADAGTRGY